MVEEVKGITIEMRKEADRLWKKGEYDQAAVLARYADQLQAVLADEHPVAGARTVRRKSELQPEDVL